MSSIKHWFQLVRFSHTLFALPFALAALFLASNGWPKAMVLLWVVVCMATARNAAMAYNRLVDRDIDAANPRTTSRHLPAGLLTPRAVRLFVLVNSGIFVLASWMLNPLCLALSPVALLLVLGYSHAKRYTSFCHVLLGLAIGISPLAAGMATTGQFLPGPAWLGLSLWLWITGFDIVYSTQDADFDRANGLFSIPARLGRTQSLVLAGVFHFMVPFALWAAGQSEGFGMRWDGMVLLTTLVLLWTHIARSGDDLRMQSGFFRANVLVSVLVLAGAMWESLAP